MNRAILDDRSIAHRRQLLLERLGSVRVVYTDVDNTLLGPGGSIVMTADQQYCDEPIRAVIGLNQKEIDIVMVSGRTRAQLREAARLFSLSNYICELGSLIVYGRGQETLVNYDFEPTATKGLYRTIEESGAPELLLQHFAGTLEYHEPWSLGRECTHLFRGHIATGQANILLATNGLGNLKVIDNGLVHRRGTLQSLSEVHAYHLLPIEVSKTSAIFKDRQHRGFSRIETAAVGDSLTDIDMAEAVGTFFLVNNGTADTPALTAALLQRDNAYLTQESMGLGWAEVAELLLSGASAHQEQA